MPRWDATCKNFITKNALLEKMERELEKTLGEWSHDDASLTGMEGRAEED